MRVLEGYTQDEVADKLGVAQSTVSRIENSFNEHYGQPVQ